MLTDCHTHDHTSLTGVISLQPCELEAMKAGHVYSVGIHPWHAADISAEDRLRLEKVAERRDVVMIGESGLDRMCDTPLKIQEQTFRDMIELSERVRKPLIIHAVKAFQDIIAIHREMHPVQPWIIHGYRGKPEMALQLLREGFYLSLGQRYNEAALAVIPSDRLLCESDEADSPPCLGAATAENLQRLIGRAGGE